MNKCESCGIEIQGNYKICYSCNQKKKAEYQKAKEYKYEPDMEKIRSMLLSYGKDLVVGDKLKLDELGDFLQKAEKYIQTGAWG